MSPENELEISGYFENLSIIADFIVQAATAAGLDDRAVYAVQMAVDEACTNIITHAYGGEGRGSIRLAYQIQRDGFKLPFMTGVNHLTRPMCPNLTLPLPSTGGQGGMGLFPDPPLS
ncbi:MAG: ATP-binding protein [Anaerolineae bacterium]